MGCNCGSGHPVCFCRVCHRTAAGTVSDPCMVHGAQILHLMGIKYLYQLNVFLYCMFFFIGATVVVLLIRGPSKWRRLTKEERLAQAYARG